MKIVFAIIINLMVAALVSAKSYAMTSKEKTLVTIGGGCAVGAGAGFVIDARDDNPRKSTQGTIAASALVGCATGALISWFFQPDVEAKVDAELKAYREMDRNQGRILIDKDSLLSNGPDRVSCPEDKEYYLLCTGKDGQPGACSEDLGITYLSSNWAVQYVAFYSPEGCFKGPYSNDVNMKKHFKLLEKPILENAK